MFIARRRFILKTCGTTTPLQCLKPLMVLVEQYAGFDEVEVVMSNICYFAVIFVIFAAGNLNDALNMWPI
jgi:hypothetical protein